MEAGAKRSSEKGTQMPEEVKRSWSLNYILLTAVISVVTGIIGYSIDYFLNKPPTRVLQITGSQPKNLLELSPQVDKVIEANFSLKKESGVALRSFYQYSVSIKNVGDEAVENFPVVVGTGNKDVVLIKPPGIETNPSHLLSVIKLQRNEALVETFKDEWTIGLLNPDESVTFEYIAYSPKRVGRTEFQAVARAKDWEIRYDVVEDVDDRDTEVLIYVTMAMMTIGLLLMIVSTLMRRK